MFLWLIKDIKEIRIKGIAVLGNVHIDDKKLEKIEEYKLLKDETTRM